jgi:hypothetical protein
MHDQILQDPPSPSLPSPPLTRRVPEPSKPPHLSAPGVHPTPLPSTPLWTETEADHLGLHPFSLPSRPNERTRPPLCISRVPQASQPPLPCTTTAKLPPTRSEHVTLGMLRKPTLHPSSVTLDHAQLLNTSPAPYWRRRPPPLAR